MCGSSYLYTFFALFDSQPIGICRGLILLKVCGYSNLLGATLNSKIQSFRFYGNRRNECLLNDIQLSNKIVVGIFKNYRSLALLLFLLTQNTKLQLFSSCNAGTALDDNPIVLCRSLPRVWRSNTDLILGRLELHLYALLRKFDFWYPRLLVNFDALIYVVLAIGNGDKGAALRCVFVCIDNNQQALIGPLNSQPRRTLGNFVLEIGGNDNFLFSAIATESQIVWRDCNLGDKWRTAILLFNSFTTLTSGENHSDGCQQKQQFFHSNINLSLIINFLNFITIRTSIVVCKLFAQTESVVLKTYFRIQALTKPRQ